MSRYRIWLVGQGWVSVDAGTSREALRAARALHPSATITGIGETPNAVGEAAGGQR